MGRRGREPQKSDESRAIALLDEAVGRASPFRTAATQYIVLGDGRRRGAVRALTKAATPPTVPIISIDPEYGSAVKVAKNKGAYRRARAKGQKVACPGANKNAYRSTRKVQYLGQEAEKYKFDKEALAKVDNLVVISICAHTPAWKFLSRAKGAGRGLKVYAACVRCCFPGLRQPTEAIEGTQEWQLVYPRPASAGKRPLAAAERRYGIRQKARRKEMMARRRLRQKKLIARRKKEAEQEKARATKRKKARRAAPKKTGRVRKSRSRKKRPVPKTKTAGRGRGRTQS
jgi:hypothetical protein